MIYELVVAPDSLDANETELCGNLLSILNQNDNSRLENQSWIKSMRLFSNTSMVIRTH